MVRRTKAEAAATREALIDAAEEMFLEHGVARTSLEQVARHAGMTRGALYWHFKNKADLVKAMLQRVHLPFQDLFDQVDTVCPQASPLEAIRAACIHGLEQLETPQKIRVHTILTYRCELFGDIDPQEMEREITEEIFEVLQHYFKMAEAQGQLKNISADVATEMLYALLSGLFHTWIRQPEDYSISQQGRVLLDTLLNMMGGKDSPD